jgi:hypothetical protein
MKVGVIFQLHVYRANGAAVEFTEATTRNPPTREDVEEWACVVHIDFVPAIGSCIRFPAPDHGQAANRAAEAELLGEFRIGGGGTPVSGHSVASPPGAHGRIGDKGSGSAGVAMRRRLCTSAVERSRSS